MNFSPNTIWLFDYDLTLYTSKERYVLESLDKRITAFVQNLLQVSEVEASRIREKYLVEFGTTLAGLRAKHGVDPNAFFDFIHVPEFLIYPPFSLEKKSLLESLPGRKVVFTNGRGDWCERGLQSMGISSCFDRVFDLSCMDWEGKPSESAYEKMEVFLGKLYGTFSKKDVVFLDDGKRNLPKAKSRGWTTIFVGGTLEEDLADYSIDSIFELQEIFPTLKERIYV